MSELLSVSVTVSPAPSTTPLRRHACRCSCWRVTASRWREAAPLPLLLAAVARIWSCSGWNVARTLPASCLDDAGQVLLLRSTEATFKDMLGSRVARKLLQARRPLF